MSTKPRTAFTIFKQTHLFAYHTSPLNYLLLLSLMVCTVLGAFVIIKSNEYIINSATSILEGHTSFQSVVIGISCFALTRCVLIVFNLLESLVSEKFLLQLDYNFSHKLLHKSATCHWECYENHPLMSAMHQAQTASLEQIKSFIFIGFEIVTQGLSLIVSVSLLLTIHPIALILYLLCVYPAFKSFNIFSGPTYALFEKIPPLTQKQSYFFHLCGDKISHQAFKFHRLFSFIHGKWAACYDEEYKLRLHILSKHEIGFQIARFLSFIPELLILGWVAFEISKGRHEIGFLMLTWGVVYRISDAVDIMIGNFQAIKQEAHYAESFFQVLDFEEDSTTQNASSHNTSSPSSITINDLSYTYPQANTPSLNDLALTIQPGEKIALVGHNGCGKSTLTTLLLSLSSNYHGNLTLGGHQVACILQDFIHYELTIKENISLGHESHDFSDQDIYDLLDQVGLSQLIQTLPQGIHTPLGSLDSGLDLSKGQWQRLAIARLLANPYATLWILDEPTAYLDPISEIELYELIYRLAKDRTVIFISHRLGFTKRADRILVMANGSVVEEGTHQELLQHKEGIYYSMYTAQERWYTLTS